MKIDPATEKMLRAAFHDGAHAMRYYGDNHVHFWGKQADAIFAKFLSTLESETPTIRVRLCIYCGCPLKAGLSKEIRPGCFSHVECDAEHEEAVSMDSHEAETPAPNCPHCGGKGHVGCGGIYRDCSCKKTETPAPVQRDWLEDAGHENGKYQNLCSQCGNLFVGHKRRVTCRDCARPAPVQPGDLAMRISEVVAKRVDMESIAEELASLIQPHLTPAQGEPVAWMVVNSTRKFICKEREDVKRWATNDEPIQPLYLSPPASPDILQNKIIQKSKELQAEPTGAKNVYDRVRDALHLAGNRWDEWGERACMVRDVLQQSLDAPSLPDVAKLSEADELQINAESLSRTVGRSTKHINNLIAERDGLNRGYQAEKNDRLAGLATIRGLRDDIAKLTADRDEALELSRQSFSNAVKFCDERDADERMRTLRGGGVSGSRL